MPGVEVDDKKLFDLKNGGFGIIHLDPGLHKISLTQLGTPFIDLKIEVTAGQEYYLTYLASWNKSDYERWSKRIQKQPVKGLKEYAQLRVGQEGGIRSDILRSKFDPRFYFLSNDVGAQKIQSTKQIFP